MTAEARVQIEATGTRAALTVHIDPAGAPALAPVLGVPLPSRPNTVAAAGDLLALWLGPDEWLVLPTDDAPGLEARLRLAAGERPLSVVDTSAARTGFTVGGASARDVLAHGCALDLDPRVFGPGTCAQTRLGLAHVILVAPCAATGEAFLVLVRPSFARYLGDWLLDAATEYRL